MERLLIGQEWLLFYCEDQRSCLNSYVGWLTQACNFNSKGYNILFWPPRARTSMDVCTCTCVSAHTQIKNKIFFLLKRKGLFCITVLKGSVCCQFVLFLWVCSEAKHHDGNSERPRSRKARQWRAGTKYPPRAHPHDLCSPTGPHTLKNLQIPKMVLPAGQQAFHLLKPVEDISYWYHQL